jgi:transposase
MAAKLENCSKEEQQSVIRFSWTEGVLDAQIHHCMCAQNGDNALSHKVVYEWIEIFKNGLTNVTDAECSGHPTTATTAQNQEGPILETYLERGTTVTSATYCDILQEGLKPAVCSKRKQTVRGCPIVARQCLSPYCGLHIGNLQEIEVGSRGTSSSQSRFSAI